MFNVTRSLIRPKTNTRDEDSLLLSQCKATLRVNQLIREGSDNAVKYNKCDKLDENPNRHTGSEWRCDYPFQNQEDNTLQEVDECILYQTKGEPRLSLLHI